MLWHFSKSFSIPWQQLCKWAPYTTLKVLQGVFAAMSSEVLVHRDSEWPAGPLMQQDFLKPVSDYPFFWLVINFNQWACNCDTTLFRQTVAVFSVQVLFSSSSAYIKQFKLESVVMLAFRPSYQQTPVTTLLSARQLTSSLWGFRWESATRWQYDTEKRGQRRHHGLCWCVCVTVDGVCVVLLCIQAGSLSDYRWSARAGQNQA